MRSETIGKLSEALSKAQGVMEAAKKDSINPHFKNKYADLAAVIEAIKEPLSQHGLSYTQTFIEENEKTSLMTTLMHVSGEWIQSKLKLIVIKNDMQGLGSAITYARRYSLSSIAGLTQDDDDGERSTGRNSREDLKPPFHMGPIENQKIKELTDMAKITKEQLPSIIKSKFNCSYSQMSESNYRDLVIFLQEEAQKELAEDDFT